MSITPKNWSSFQHYKDRSPSWIKLHRGILDDFAFSRLPVASRALAPMLWLLASEYDEGRIKASNEEIAFRFRMSIDDLEEALTPLIDSGFFLASEPLAERKPEAILEKRNIDKTEKEKIAAAPLVEPKPERKSRKGNQTPLPDHYAMPDRVNAYGLGLGLTASELAREHERFRNHAKQNDRRCVDWEAAERNWLLGSAEKLGRAPPVDASQAANDGKFYAADGTPERDAWDAYGMHKAGKPFPRDKNGGWRFPSQWPPNYQKPEVTHERPALRMQGMN